jgi:hypothetical protein
VISLGEFAKRGFGQCRPGNHQRLARARALAAVSSGTVATSRRLCRCRGEGFDGRWISSVSVLPGVKMMEEDKGLLQHTE